MRKGGREEVRKGGRGEEGGNRRYSKYFSQLHA